jgi:hypothetical protein
MGGALALKNEEVQARIAGYHEPLPQRNRGTRRVD